MTTGMWRGSQKPKRRVAACVTLDDLQILQVCRLAGYKAIRAACVTIVGSEPKKSAAACGEVGRNGLSTWWRVQHSVETGLLCFSRGWPWGTSLWLVLLGEGLMCTNLRS